MHNIISGLPEVYWESPNSQISGPGNPIRLSFACCSFKYSFHALCEREGAHVTLALRRVCRCVLYAATTVLRLAAHVDQFYFRQDVTSQHDMDQTTTKNNISHLN